MKSVFCLVVYDRMRAVDNLVRNFLSTMGRETMHYFDIILCRFQKVVVDLEIFECLSARLFLCLLPHANPGVRIKHVRLFSGFFWVLIEMNQIVSICHLFGFGNKIGCEFISLW